MYNSLIYTNGCSFTEGAYYNNRTECWPWQVNIKGFDVLNDALGGGSNHRILRTSVDTVTRMHGRITCAIIQWTDPARSEVPGEESYKKIFRDESISDTLAFSNWIDQINTIDRFFTLLSIPVFFFNGFVSLTGFNIKDEIDKERILRKIATIDKTKWILPYDTTLTRWIGDKRHFLPDGHLTPAANNIVATKIREFVDDRLA